MSSSLYGRQVYENTNSRSDHSQNKQFVCLGLLGKEHGIRKPLYHNEFHVPPTPLILGAVEPLHLKKQGDNRNGKLQSRAPRINELMQQFLYAMTEKVRSLQPRLKVKYVGHGEQDGDNGTIRHCKLSGGERNRHELADSFFQYKNLGHQINLAGARCKTIPRSASSNW